MDTNLNTAFYDVQTGWWIPSSGINALFHVDLNGNSEWIGKFNGCSKENGWMITKIIATEDELLFFSGTEFTLWKLSKSEPNLSGLNYSSYQVEMIPNVEKVRNEIWIFPNVFTVPILVLSLLDMSVKEVPWACDVKYGESSITRTIVRDNYIFFANRAMNHIKIGSVDTTNRSISYIDLPSKKYVNCIDAYNGKIWVLCRDMKGRAIIEKVGVPSGTKEYLDVSDHIQLSDSISNTYFRMIVRDQYIYFIGNSKHTITALNINAMIVVEIADVNSQYTGTSNSKNVRTDIQLVDDSVLIYSCVSGKVQQFNMNNQSLTSLDFSLNQLTQTALKANMSDNAVMNENDFITLEKFLQALVENTL